MCEVQCCIAGCGPAGAMLGLLLARAGLRVVVLEKHSDFLRDFRGDTVHPSSLDVLHEIGLARAFLKLPHTEVSDLAVRLPSGETIGVDLRRLKTRYPFVAFVPQWDFLDWLTDQARRYPGFDLRMNAETTGLLFENDEVVGLRYGAGQEIRAALTVGADGRDSITRAAAGLKSRATSAPMDVWWFRIPRRPEEPESVSLRLGVGHLMAMLYRGDYWQCAYLIPKGRDAELRQEGLEGLHREVLSLVPELSDRIEELNDWDQVKLLSVRSDRLVKWYRPGYLAIGDAAHAMSPVGGVGINMAIQDAVAAANAVWKPLAEGTLSTDHLAAVQRRRQLSIRLVQAFQSAIQDAVLGPTLGAGQLPEPARFVLNTPWLRDIPARLLAYGVSRPPVRSPELPPLH